MIIFNLALLIKLYNNISCLLLFICSLSILGGLCSEVLYCVVDFFHFYLVLLPLINFHHIRAIVYLLKLHFVLFYYF